MAKIAHALLAGVLGVLAAHAQAGDIILRHNLAGPDAALLIELTNRYNSGHKGDKVVLQHLSSVPDVHVLPHMALLDEDEYQKFFGTRPRMQPLQPLMRSAREKFDPARLYPVLADTVANAKGQLEALPLAMSIPVLYYNKDAFRKAGLDPDQPPHTWWQVQTAAGKLLDAGYRCPYTSSQSEWVHVENLATQHKEPIAERERNGRTKFSFNNMVEVKHLALLTSWYKSLYFHYFGRGREADQKFASGECGMLTSDATLYKRIAPGSGFEVGIADLPYYDDVRDAAPGRVLPDGQALWVLAGKKSAEYKTVADFIAFLMKPEVQKEWVAGTGYLPMTPMAADVLPAEGQARDVLRAAVRRLGEHQFVTSTRLKILPGFDRVRSIIYEELEAVWANRKPAKAALDQAVERGNAVMHGASPLGLAAGVK